MAQATLPSEGGHNRPLCQRHLLSRPAVLGSGPKARGLGWGVQGGSPALPNGGRNEAQGKNSNQKDSDTAGHYVRGGSLGRPL